MHLLHPRRSFSYNCFFASCWLRLSNKIPFFRREDFHTPDTLIPNQMLCLSYSFKRTDCCRYLSEQDAVCPVRSSMESWSHFNLVFPKQATGSGCPKAVSGKPILSSAGSIFEVRLIPRFVFGMGLTHPFTITHKAHFLLF